MRRRLIRVLAGEPRPAGLEGKESCCVVNISALRRELILLAYTLARLCRKIERQRHLIGLLPDQMETIETVCLHVPSPANPRAMRVAGVLRSDPRDRRMLSQICNTIGAGRRSIERRFLEETGMTLGMRRQQLRPRQGMRLLAEGAKATHAALGAGYSTAREFIFMFPKMWGTAPARIFGKGGGGDE